MNVQSILRSKGETVYTASPSASVASILSTFKDKRVGALVVIDDGRRMLGLITERGIVLNLLDYGCDLLDLPVSEVMTRDVIACAPEDDIIRVMEVMTERRVRHLPVMCEGELCGIVSIGDAVKKRLDEVEREARALHDYVTGVC